MAEGTLLGAKLSFEATSRRRISGDEADSIVPLFVGTFRYAGGVSGDFVIQPKLDGELMTLGVYGTPPAFRLIKTRPRESASPLEVRGFPGWDVIFEDPVQYEISIPKRELRAAGNPLHFAAYCTTRANPKDDLPPMPGVLVTMLLAYHLLLKEFYLTSSA